MKTIIKIMLILSVSMISTSLNSKKDVIDGINIENSSVVAASNIQQENTNTQNIEQTTEPEMVAVEEEIVYDGLTMAELATRLDKNLNSTLAGYGYTFASKSIELGLDPYLAVAIVLHETGCKWNCSELLKKCNNVGGIKGKPGCNGGSYQKFATLDEGIEYYLNFLYNKYYAKGYTTADLLQPVYAGSNAWASKINYYINEIKNS